MLISRREWVAFTVLMMVAVLGVFPSLLMYMRIETPALLLAEDGVYETLGVLACIAAVAVFVRLAITQRSQRAWFALLAIGTLFLAMEELSWGQRLFDISLSPEIRSRNFQGEMNLHNSRLLQEKHGSVNFYFLLCYLLYFVAVPIAALLFESLNRVGARLRLPVPSLLVAVAVLVAQKANSINLAVLTSLEGSVVGSRLPEAYECNLQIIILVFALECLFRPATPYSESPGQCR